MRGPFKKLMRNFCRIKKQSLFTRGNIGKKRINLLALLHHDGNEAGIDVHHDDEEDEEKIERRSRLYVDA